MGIDGQRTRRADAQRMSVRRRTREANEADRAAAAGAIFHHDGLAKGFAEFFADDARDAVRGSAGRKGNDHGQVARGKPLRISEGRGKQPGSEQSTP